MKLPFYSILLAIVLCNMLSRLAQAQSRCRDIFGFELEFAYVGESGEAFFQDPREDFEYELTKVLKFVAQSVNEYNGWDQIKYTNISKKHVGIDFPKLVVYWNDTLGRTWQVAQESVGGHLYDGLEIISPTLTSVDEAAFLIERMRNEMMLAEGPLSGLHIWIDSSCLKNKENTMGLLRLLLDYENIWSSLLKSTFSLPTVSKRKRFWASYSSCNPGLLHELRTYAERNNRYISQTDLRGIFLRHLDEELKCIRMKRLPLPGTRAARKVWRYKEVNLASAIGLTEQMIDAVEFRAWRLLGGAEFKAAVEILKRIVYAAAYPESRHILEKELNNRVVARSNAKWRQVSEEEIIFGHFASTGRYLRQHNDPKFFMDPKYVN